MNKLYTSTLSLFVILSCLVHFCYAGDDKKQSYVIAYNTAVKDTAGKTNYEVFTINPDGTNPVNITNSADVAWVYHAYHNRLYFVSDRDTCYRCYFLYSSDAKGMNVKKVSSLQLEDSWMDTRNNGKELIVSGRVGKELRYQLFVIDTETGQYNQVTKDTAAMHLDPAFSPDGKKIAFIYRKNKRDGTQNEELYIMNTDGSGLMQLTYYPQDNVSRKDNGYKAGAPRWHPTENYITYVSKQNGLNNIYAVTPDGKKQWKLTESKKNEGWHNWSADGKWLVFDQANDEETQYHIMLMNWESKEIKQLTNAKYRYQQSPVFLQKE